MIARPTLAALALGGSLMGCMTPVYGDGDRVAQPRTVTGFDTVSLTNNLDVDVVVDPLADFSAVIRCDQNLLPFILTDVADQRLTISTRSGRWLIPARDCGVELTMPMALTFDVSGAGALFVEGAVDLEEAFVSSAGSLIATDLDSAAVWADLSGSGDLVLRGRTDALFASVNSSGDLDAQDLTAVSAELTLSGSGSLWATATERADVSLSGSGEVHLYGGAQDISQNLSGSGDVIVH
ncbi:MAG: head GIN domain-containing protein [Myxococcota bacterium]